MPPWSLVEVLASVPDPRSRPGRIPPLAALLSRATVPLLAGMPSLEALAPCGRDPGPPLAPARGFTPGKTPGKSALSKWFRRLDLDAVENARRRWLARRRQQG